MDVIPVWLLKLVVGFLVLVGTGSYIMTSGKTKTRPGYHHVPVKDEKAAEAIRLIENMDVSPEALEGLKKIGSAFSAKPYGGDVQSASFENLQEYYQKQSREEVLKRYVEPTG